MNLEDLEEVVEIIEASENVQVIQPDEVAAVVYASVVHKSKEEEPILVEQVIEELNEVEPFEDELESKTETPEVKTYTHEQGNLSKGIIIQRGLNRWSNNSEKIRISFKSENLKKCF